MAAGTSASSRPTKHQCQTLQGVADRGSREVHGRDKQRQTDNQDEHSQPNASSALTHPGIVLFTKSATSQHLGRAGDRFVAHTASLTGHKNAPPLVCTDLSLEIPTLVRLNYRRSLQRPGHVDI